MGTVSEAKDILTYAAVPETIVQAICLPIGFRLILDKRSLDQWRGRCAIAAGAASVIVSAVVVALMWPICWRSVWTNRGQVEPVLVFLWMLLLLFLGCTVVGLVLVRRATEYSRKAQPPSRVR